MKNEYIKSPLNYIGGKYKILNQIIPLFPNDINCFVDLFGGGFNVGINVQAQVLFYNDIITPLCELMEIFKNYSSQDLVSAIDRNIVKNNINNRDLESFLALRAKYNSYNYKDDFEKSIDFFTLILYSFNYQIRFNSKMEFNTPFGKNRSSFNDSIKMNLVAFVDRMNEINVQITNFSFTDFDFSILSFGDFVYCDPPYLISVGSYNDGKRGTNEWNKQDDMMLFTLLDDLNSRGIRFALSDVFYANGKSNDLLIEWSKKYVVHDINNSYNNSNYQRKSKNDIKEVLITNY